MKILGILTDWYFNEYRKLHDTYGGIGYYRIHKPLEALGQTTIGKRIKEYTNYADVVRGYDAVLIKPISNPVGAKFIQACLQEGVKFIVDQDDNLFEGRPSHGFYKELSKGSPDRAIVGAFCSFADAMICSTEPLKDYYTKWFKEVHKREIPMFVSPNYNDIKDFDFEPLRIKKDKITIGWAGSRSHYDDLKMVMPALKYILNKNKNVELELCGGVEEEKVEWLFGDTSQEYLDRVILTPGTGGYDTYPAFLANKGWDIGIAPLIDDEFNRCKSHIKWMEYAMYKVPCVASKVYPYYKDIQGKKVIQHAKTGFLAKGKEDWIKYLQLLIDNENLRRKIGENAYNYVKENWQWDKTRLEAIWEEINKLPIKTLKDYGL